ncbi:zf-HC2 domain-containing protein [Dactylosporangium sp. NPDC048998]|uniref:zf-HC2 domain-containing protein n=1 Tax=Dactylosporangium sp. NPDC048998 TaxID=3363976 RepID=UPI003710E165
MECERYREALSARLDGEDEPIEPALVDAHLAGCAACREWERQAVAVTRLVRLQPMPAAPPSVESLLAGFRSAQADGPQPADRPAGKAERVAGTTAAGAARALPRRRLVLVLRVLLGAFGAAQFVLGITQAATAATANHLHGSGHVFHESAAWNVAIGAGFAWIATRRATPAGALPMLTAFVALLALLSASDLMAGTVETTRLVSHAFVLAGYAIVVALSRPALDPGRPPAGRQGPPWQWRRPAALDEEPPAPAPARLRLVQGQAHAGNALRKAA